MFRADMGEERTVRDYRDREVRITSKAVTHLRARQPDRLRRLEAVVSTVAAPERVTRSPRLSRTEHFYARYGGDFLVRVAVIYRPTPDGWVGEVVTAHLLRQVGSEEEQLWP